MLPSYISNALNLEKRYNFIRYFIGLHRLSSTLKKQKKKKKKGNMK